MFSELFIKLNGAHYLLTDDIKVRKNSTLNYTKKIPFSQRSEVSKKSFSLTQKIPTSLTQKIKKYKQNFIDLGEHPKIYLSQFIMSGLLFNKQKSTCQRKYYINIKQTLQLSYVIHHANTIKHKTLWRDKKPPVVIVTTSSLLILGLGSK